MPGTGLARDYPAVLKFIWLQILPRVLGLAKIMFKTDNVHTAEESGGNLAWVAASASTGTSGIYYEARKVIKSSVVSYDVDKQEDLWAWTVEHVARDEQERETFQLEG
jgi:hypothetical protein